MSDVINNNILQGKWKEVKGEVQKVWGNLTDDELEKTKGKITSLSGKEEEFRLRINDLIASLRSSAQN